MTPEALPSRVELARTHRQAGGRVAAVLPVHAPRALLRAFGILPMEVWGPPGVDATPGMRRLQPYVCSIVRNALAFLEAGGLEVTDLLLVPHACDSLQGLGSVQIDFVRPRQGEVGLKNPFSLTSAAKFGLLFAVVLIVVAAVERYIPGRGYYVVAALAGLHDVDAITLSMAGLARGGGIDLATAAGALVVAALANTLLKCGMVVATASGRLRRSMVTVTGALVVVGVAAILLA